jgi:hypothetical protein
MRERHSATDGAGWRGSLQGACSGDHVRASALKALRWCCKAARQNNVVGRGRERRAKGQRRASNLAVVDSSGTIGARLDLARGMKMDSCWTAMATTRIGSGGQRIISLARLSKTFRGGQMERGRDRWA